jgi:hypothetical protein
VTLVTHLTADTRQFIAEALFLRRSVNHTGEVQTDSETQAYIALKTARLLGVFDEYWALMQSADVISVRVRNLDAPPPSPPPKGRERKPAVAPPTSP